MGDNLTSGYITLPKAAAYIGRSPRWLRRRLPLIPHFRDGQISFTKEDLDRYMATKRVEPLKPAAKPDLDDILSSIDSVPRRRRAARK
jgi:hypothetical protein